LEEWKAPTNNSQNSLEIRIEKRSDITRENRNNIKPDTDTLMLIYQHWIDVGSDKHNLTGNKQANKQNLERWYRELVVENNYFPNDLPIKDVLERFFRDLTHGSHPLNGFNLRSYLGSFHAWWYKHGNDIRAEYATPIDETHRLADHSQYNVDNVDQQLLKMFGKDIPPIFHKYVTDKTLIQ